MELFGIHWTAFEIIVTSFAAGASLGISYGQWQERKANGTQFWKGIAKEAIRLRNRKG